MIVPSVPTVCTNPADRRPDPTLRLSRLLRENMSRAEAGLPPIHEFRFMDVNHEFETCYEIADENPNFTAAQPLPSGYNP